MIRVIRAVRYVQSADFYAEIGLDYPVGLDVIVSLAWGIVLVGLGWGLWRLRPRAYYAARILLPVYTAFELGWLALFAQANYDIGRLPFAALAAVVAVLLGLRLLTRRSVRAPFMKKTNKGGPDDD